jgi:hypothetical protein
MPLLLLLLHLRPPPPSRMDSLPPHLGRGLRQSLAPAPNEVAVLACTTTTICQQYRDTIIMSVVEATLRLLTSPLMEAGNPKKNFALLGICTKQSHEFYAYCYYATSPQGNCTVRDGDGGDHGSSTTLKSFFSRDDSAPF